MQQSCDVHLNFNLIYDLCFPFSNIMLKFAKECQDAVSVVQYLGVIAKQPQ